MIGKRVLVTGSGTGSAARLPLNSPVKAPTSPCIMRMMPQGAQSAVDEIRAMGRQAEAFQANFDSRGGGGRASPSGRSRSSAALTAW